MAPAWSKNSNPCVALRHTARPHRTPRGDSAINGGRTGARETPRQNTAAVHPRPRHRRAADADTTAPWLDSRPPRCHETPASARVLAIDWYSDSESGPGRPGEWAADRVWQRRL